MFTRFITERNSVKERGKTHHGDGMIRNSEEGGGGEREEAETQTQRIEAVGGGGRQRQRQRPRHKEERRLGWVG